MQFTWFQCTQTALPGEGDLVSGADLTPGKVGGVSPAAGKSRRRPISHQPFTQGTS